MLLIVVSFFTHASLPPSPSRLYMTRHGMTAGPVIAVHTAHALVLLKLKDAADPLRRKVGEDCYMLWGVVKYSRGRYHGLYLNFLVNSFHPIYLSIDQDEMANGRVVYLQEEVPGTNSYVTNNHYVQSTHLARPTASTSPYMNMSTPNGSPPAYNIIAAQYSAQSMSGHEYQGSVNMGLMGRQVLLIDPSMATFNSIDITYMYLMHNRGGCNN